MKHRFPSFLGRGLGLVLAGLALLAALGYRGGCPPQPCVYGRDVDPFFFQETLARAGIPPSRFAVQALMRWAAFEYTAACWNPLATTLVLGQVCDFNPQGVQNYPSREMGILATAQTLRLPRYRALREMLSGHAFSVDGLREALGFWIHGTEDGCYGYCEALLREWQWLWYEIHTPPVPETCPPGTFRLLLYDTARAEGRARGGICVPRIEAYWNGSALPLAFFPKSRFAARWEGTVSGPDRLRVTLEGQAQVRLWLDDRPLNPEGEMLVPSGIHRLQVLLEDVRPPVRFGLSGEKGISSDPRILGFTPLPAVTCPPTPCTPGFQVDEAFLARVLEALGAPVTPFGLRALAAWRDQVGSTACWNPLGLARDMPTWSCPAPSGRQHFRDPAMGAYATAAALSFSDAWPIRDMLTLRRFDRNRIEEALSLWSTGKPRQCGDACQELVQTWAALWNRLVRRPEGEAVLTCRAASGCPKGYTVEVAFFRDLLRGLGLPATPERLALLTLWQDQVTSRGCWNPLGLARPTTWNMCTEGGDMHFATREDALRAMWTAFALPEHAALYRLLAGKAVSAEDVDAALRSWFGVAENDPCPVCERLLAAWQKAGTSITETFGPETRGRK